MKGDILAASLSEDLMPNDNIYGENQHQHHRQHQRTGSGRGYKETRTTANNFMNNNIKTTIVNSNKGDNNSNRSSVSSGGSGSSSSSSFDSVNIHHLINSSKKNNPNSLYDKLRKFFLFSLIITGLIVCISSLICILLLPTIVTNEISKRLVLKNNSLLLERWSKPNVPMFFKVWLFDVKNAQEIIDIKGTRPQVKEIGPFVFNLKRKKDIVSFAGENLYYTERKIYHFNQELSCCAINTTVTIPNIPLVAVVDRALSYNLPLVGRFIPRLINRAIQSLREQLFVRRQVGEILFDGYEVELLKMVSRVGSLVGLPQTQQRFALLKGRNDTWRPEQDGVWAINTGAKDRKMFGRVSSWNSYRQLPFWASQACNTINGSDGTLFPPPIDRTKPLYIFNQELCRTVNLVFDRPSDIHSIKAYRFVLNPINFAHTMKAGSSINSDNTQFTNQRLANTQITPGNNNNNNNNNQRQQTPRILRFDQSNNKPQQQQQGQGQTAAAAAGNSLSGQPQSLLRDTSGSHTARASASTSIRDNHQHHDHHHHDKNINLQAAPSEPKMSVATSSGPDSHETSNVRSQEGRSQLMETNLNNNNNNNNNKPGNMMVVNELNKSAAKAEQHRLVQVAQEQQAQVDRQSVSRRNPFTCFCDRKTTNLNGINVCEFDGLIELSKCTKQAQVIFGSMPHFYQSDPRLLKQVAGLEPNASRHTTFLDIEPNTGLVLGGKRRVQLNIIIKHNNEVDGFQNINDMLVPVVWFEESAMIPEETAKMFKSIYTDKIRLIRTVMGSLFFIALAVTITALMASHYWTSCFSSCFDAHNADVKRCSKKNKSSATNNSDSNTKKMIKRLSPESGIASGGSGSMISSSGDKSAHSIVTSSEGAASAPSTNEDASCLIREPGLSGGRGSGGRTESSLIMVNQNTHNAAASSPLLANTSSERQQFVTERHLVRGGKRQHMEEDNFLTLSHNKLDNNMGRHLNENKSVEFAIHYNDTLTLVEGQKQQQQQQQNGQNS